jgi:hypothetical protein
MWANSESTELWPNAMHRFATRFVFEFLGALGVLAAKILISV